jgi:predicted dehydrogenase
MCELEKLLIKRILIVGYGSIGKRHFRIASELFPGADIKVYSRRSLNLGEFLTSMESVISYKPNIAIVANPSPFHIEICKELLKTDTHLLIEKPLSNSTNGVSELIAQSRERNLTVMVGYNLRFSPSLEYFSRLIKEKVIGDVHSVRCEVGQYLPSWRPNTDYKQSVSARQDLGGGVLLELSHEIDYLRWIFGEFNWVRATLSRQSVLKVDVEDTAHMTIGFSTDGANRQLIASLSLDFIRHDHTRTCIAIGEGGSLRWNGITGSVELMKNGEKYWEQIFLKQSHPDETYMAEWMHFVECIEASKPPLVTAIDGLRVLEIIEAARLSAPTGKQTAVVSKNLESDLTP